MTLAFLAAELLLDDHSQRQGGRKSWGVQIGRENLWDGIVGCEVSGESLGLWCFKHLPSRLAKNLARGEHFCRYEKGERQLGI